MADEPADAGWEWDRYWRSGRIAACIETAEGGYGGAIAKIWRAFAAGLPANARVIDVGAGNGAAALEIVRANASASVDAVDLAEIDPFAVAARHGELAGRLRIHPRTDMTALAFEDGRFDAAIAQFAIEYAPITEALAEIARVLKPGAPFCAVMHAKEGAPAAEAARAAEDADLLLSDTGLCAAAEAALRAAKAVEAPGAGAEPGLIAEARRGADALEREVLAARERAAERPADDMTARVTDVLDHLYAVRRDGELEELLAKIDEARVEIAAHRRRVRALCNAARTKEEIAALAANGPPGLQFEEPKSVLGDDGALLGWRLDARKS